MNSVCAAAPGVLGVTGMETAEILRGMVAHVRPDAVIAVDALPRALQAHRLNDPDCGYGHHAGLGRG